MPEARKGVKEGDPNIDENGFDIYPKWVDSQEEDELQTKRTTVKGKPVVTKYIRVLVNNAEEEAEVTGKPVGQPAGWKV